MSGQPPPTSAAEEESELAALFAQQLDLLEQVIAQQLALMKGQPADFPQAPADGAPQAMATRVIPMPAALRSAFLVLRAAGDEAAPHLSGGWLLEGPIDAERLNRAFQAVVARHDSLRTGFELRGDEAVLVIYDHVPAALAVVTASELAAAVKACVVAYDLACPPLARLSLLRTADGRSALVFDVHHIIIDGLAIRVFFRELLAAYRGERFLTPAAQYPDYLAWLDRRAPDFATMAEFWCEHLGAPLPKLQLPTDFPRPLVRDHKGHTITHHVPAAAMQVVAREHRASTFMVFLAAYYAWLYRVTEQDDLVVGVASSTRDPALHDSLIWMNLNVIALRARPAAAMTFDELLDAVRSTCLLAYGKADYPFSQLLQRLGTTWDPCRHPVFETLIAYEKLHDQLFEFEGVQAVPIEMEKNACECDLDLEVIERDDELEIKFTFATALFRPATMHELAHSCVQTLTSQVARPNQRLSELALK